MPKDRKRDTPKMNVFAKRPWLKCRICETKWYPDARKWKTTNGVEEKILRCPKCNVKNRVPRVIVDFLIKKAEADSETEYGWD